MTREQQVDLANRMADELSLRMGDDGLRDIVRETCKTFSEAKFMLRRLRWTVIDDVTGEDLLNVGVPRGA